ncbi:MAG: magnesium/cobalt transporter CorA [Salibacteraceae bacterium]
MARFITKSKSEIGESPYELRYRGRQTKEPALMRVIDYNTEAVKEATLGEFKEISTYKTTDTVTWLNVDGLNDPQLVSQIGEVFSLDRMILSDVVNVGARPKIQEYAECLFASIKMIQLDDQSQEITVENLSIVIADRLLISFQERRGDVFEPIRERIRKQKPKIIRSGTDYLAFALLDVVIDNYIYILSVLGEQIETLEEALLEEPSRNMLERISDLKREISFMRRNINPAREMILALSKIESEYIDDENTRVHWKELQDNITLAIETADGYRDMLSDMMNIYHTTVSTKLNDVMKFLTIFSVVFIPITFIAGIYGTNFDHIPELHYEYGYYVMWGVILSVAGGMITYFRFKKWF